MSVVCDVHKCRLGFIIAVAALLAIAMAGVAASAEPKEPKEAKSKNCRMEQQCHWQDFKKICVWVKVCR
jgi:Na+-transporting methylmalonyl-CoA/oxaloacetate decarboxylase gamma subunit